ncbi:hypothetical protein BDV93DRAFT_523720, partial [Ceratobasidium sp. AG-I]
MSSDSRPAPSSLDHLVEFEWPGNNGSLPSETHPSHYPDSQAQANSYLWPEKTRAARNSGFLRLTVLSSSVLSRRGVALVDSYDEVSIGRDRCTAPRLRLKELAVSKYHANIYWDSHTKLWYIVDMGSTHGTNLVSPETPSAQASGSVSSEGYTLSKNTRLSSPKMASLPRALLHLQHIIIGGTTLVVHMHSDQLPCDACALSDNNSINLETAAAKSEVIASNALSRRPEPATPKSLQALKRNLLSRPSYAAPTDNRSRSVRGSELYVDRAELRRQRFPGWRDPEPRADPTPSQEIPNRQYRPQVQDDPRLMHATQPSDHLNTPPPISMTNVGHQLLIKKGWTPGSALGPASQSQVAPNARVEPVVPQGTTNRRGLGMSQK